MLLLSTNMLHPSQAAKSLDDAELVAQSPALLAREAAARAAVAAVPVSPATSGFLGLTASPALSPEAMRAGVAAGLLFGKLFDIPVLAPHVHTPHCEPGCAIIFAPHSHSAACNHAAAPAGALLAAAETGDVAGVTARLTAGDSTEQADEVRRVQKLVFALLCMLLFSCSTLVGLRSRGLLRMTSSTYAAC